jgi:DNA-directed RNA polymerase specialized sigma subunit
MSIHFPLLNDTINLFSLAREVALEQGDREKAERLATVINQLRQVSPNNSQAKSNLPKDASNAPMEVRRDSSMVEQSNPLPLGAPSINDRNRMILVLSAGGMTDIEIAKQLGITQEEVRIILRLSQPRSSSLETLAIKSNGSENNSNFQNSSFHKKIADIYNGWHETNMEGPK